MTGRRELSVILILLIVVGAVCLLDDPDATRDLCALLVLATLGLASSVHLLPAGQVLPPARRRRWLLLHPSPRSPI